MATLSDLQIASLLDDMAASMRSGIPIVESMRRLQSRRLGRVARVAGRIADGLERGETIASAVAGATPASYSYVVAAVEASERSGDPGLLARMAKLLRRRSELIRETRFSWFYPTLLLVVGYLIGAVLFAPGIRGLNGRDMRWPAEVIEVARWLETYAWLPLVLILLVPLILAVLASRRRRFPSAARRSLFCASLADMFTHDVPEDVAIRTAAEMSGERSLTAVQNPTLEMPAVARIVTVKDPIDSDMGLANEKHALIAKLRYQASLFSERARLHSQFWSRWVPQASMVLIGGGIILGYAYWVIAPVYMEVARW